MLRWLPMRVLGRSQCRSRYQQRASAPPNNSWLSDVSLRSQAQQRGQVGRVGPAGSIGFGKADVTRAQDALAGAPIVHL
jgi:hypothetical protein